MSTLGGVLYTDGGPGPAEMAHGLEALLRTSSADSVRATTAGSLSMAYAAFHTNSQSRGERQPLASPQGQLLTWDGRLDNPDELIAQLGTEFIERACAGPSGSREIGDARIVMAAFLRWGRHFVERLTGDFALALWDSGANALLLARDLAGTRPLYYATDGPAVYWSSEIAAILRLIPDSSEVDDDYVAGYLVCMEDSSRTPYKRIKCVPPSVVVVIGRNRTEQWRHWSHDPARELICQNDTEYEEHFQDLFRESVKCRLRTDGGVLVELSGGLDSSSIACVAHQVLQAGGVEASGIETVSYIYDGSRGGDERGFIRHVESQCGRMAHHLFDHRILAPFPGEDRVCLPSPMHCFPYNLADLARLMQTRGARVLLSGAGGDNLLISEYTALPWFADLALAGKPLQLCRSMKAWASHRKISYIQMLMQGVVLPLAPVWLRARAAARHLRVPPWLDERFVRRTGTRERMVWDPECKNFPSPSKKLQHKLLLQAINSVSQCFYRERGCVDVSYAFLHKPLVEFLLAIPIDQKARPGETRSLHRRAMRGTLPEEIRVRKGKRGPDQAVYRAIGREHARLTQLLDNGRICLRGYANPAALRETLVQAKHGLPVALAALLRTISLEIWLRAQERRPASHIPEAAAVLVAPYG